MLFVLGGAFLTLSAGALVWTFARWRTKPVKVRVLLPALALFLSAFCFRLAVGLGSARLPGLETALADLRSASLFEILGDSLVHAMQTFSMDEDYTLYLLAGREILRALSLPGAVGLYGTAITFVNVAAPVAGGAILLDILCDFFPSLRYRLHRSRTKFIFNELSEETILLAESIRARQAELGGSVGIVFANSTLDTEDERENHLFARARAVGAFCFTENVPTFNPRPITDRLFGWTKSVVYLLKSADSSSDLDIALQLRPQPGTRTAALVFSDSDADGQLLRQANRTNDGVLRVLISEKRNTVLRLLADRPLFLPLLQGGYDSLDLLVVGSGPLAEEFLCQWVWCGQLLGPQSERELALRLVAIAENDEARDRLTRRLQYRMPAFFDGEAADTASLVLLSAEPGSVEFQKTLEAHAGAVSTAVVCLENEADCRATALDLKRFFDLRELTSRRPVQLFCGAAHQGVAHAFASMDDGRCPIVPFGTLEERFGMEHVFLEDLLYYSARVNEAYETSAADRRRSLWELLASSYDLYSSMASAIHASYKLFSAGVLRTPEQAAALRPAGADPVVLEEIVKDLDLTNDILLDRLAWLEHRRWNAWTWSQGFRRPTFCQMDELIHRLADGEGRFDHKDLPLRLHPCLVPSRPGRGITGGGAVWPQVDELWRQENDPLPALRELARRLDLDGLDEVSLLVDRFARLFYRLRGQEPFDGSGKPRRGVHNDLRGYDYALLRAIPENLAAAAREQSSFGPGATLRLMLEGPGETD